MPESNLWGWKSLEGACDMKWFMGGRSLASKHLLYSLTWVCSAENSDFNEETYMIDLYM